MTETPTEILGSIWDHFQDLRTTLIKSLAVFFFFFIFSSFLISPFLTTKLFFPSDKTLEKEELIYEKWTNRSQKTTHFDLNKEQTVLLEQSEGIFFLSPTKIQVPPGKFFTLMRPKHSSLILLSPLEGFITSFRLLFWTSLCFSLPFIFVFIFQFIKPGLYREETTFIVPFFVSSFAVLAGAFFFSLYFFIPAASAYLADFNQKIGENAWSFSAYFDFLFLIITSTTLILEIGFFLFWLVHFNFITTKKLIESRRFAILGAFILGAILTPPDIFTQFLAALFFILIYEGVIIYSYLKPKKKTT